MVVNHKRHVINLDKVGDKLRPICTAGYYYQEREEIAFPYVKNHFGGYTEDSTKPYLQKQIRPLTLHKDGTLLTFGISTGFQENHAFDYAATCELQDSNSIDNAKKHIECDIRHYKNRYPIWGKGVFKTEENEIVIQYYVNWIGEYYLVEKKGKVLSDTAFVLTKSFDYKLNEAKDIYELYKFQQFDIKPDSTNYILKHKRKFKNKA
ncbi:hypothetical protein A4H97_21425 [Niastella yeongjuensis]|uniref:Uncharacterized protein n=2 Tax=Niastella yeongjuensis TaxID=354355 RepID=A0A1V9F845_9BACT|nr:hypothetical protein A4H97_21425 [Niastella yeongjuensis]SEN98030.1 hypothetical protein SAMN05660816_01797 [Niastella yeongjuensis]